MGPQSRLDLRLGEGPEGPRETLLQGQDWGSVLNQMWQIQARSRHTISTGLGAGQGLAYDPGWGAADDLGQDSVWVVPRFDVGLESGISRRLGSWISRCSELGLRGHPGSKTLGLGLSL